MNGMSRTRIALVGVAAAAALAGAAPVVLNHPSAHAATQAPTDTVRFEFGGNAAAWSDSAGVNPGTWVRLSSGSSKIEAASGTVQCRIVDSSGSVLAEQDATGAGSWAYCSFTA
jgi:hypothetical protein